MKTRIALIKARRASLRIWAEHARMNTEALNRPDLLAERAQRARIARLAELPRDVVSRFVITGTI